MAGGATFTVLLAGAGLTSASQRSSGGCGLCRHQPPRPRPRPRPLLMLPPAFSSVVHWWSQAPGTATTSSLPSLLRRIQCSTSSTPPIWDWGENSEDNYRQCAVRGWCWCEWRVRLQLRLQSCDSPLLINGGRDRDWSWCVL